MLSISAFLELPRELRDEIYRFVLQDPMKYAIAVTTKVPSPPVGPSLHSSTFVHFTTCPLTRTCKQVRHEMLPDLPSRSAADVAWKPKFYSANIPFTSKPPGPRLEVRLNVVYTEQQTSGNYVLLWLRKHHVSVLSYDVGLGVLEGTNKLSLLFRNNTSTRLTMDRGARTEPLTHKVALLLASCLADWVERYGMARCAGREGLELLQDIVRRSVDMQHYSGLELELKKVQIP